MGIKIQLNWKLFNWFVVFLDKIEYHVHIRRLLFGPLFHLCLIKLFTLELIQTIALVNIHPIIFVTPFSSFVCRWLLLYHFVITIDASIIIWRFRILFVCVRSPLGLSCLQPGSFFCLFCLHCILLVKDNLLDKIIEFELRIWCLKILSLIECVLMHHKKGKLLLRKT